MTDPIFFIPNEWLKILIEMLLAIIFGGLIGLERQSSGKTAGFRTYSLVCLGAFMFTYMSAYGFSNFYSILGKIGSFDPSRIASQVVVGIGFIGAGLIIHRRDDKVTGLTTAAGLWAASAIGMALGFNLLFLATFATIFILIILWPLKLLENKIVRKVRLLQKGLDKNNKEEDEF